MKEDIIFSLFRKLTVSRQKQKFSSLFDTIKEREGEYVLYQLPVSEKQSLNYQKCAWMKCEVQRVIAYDNFSEAQ